MLRIDASSTSVKCDNEAERVRAQPVNARSSAARCSCSCSCSATLVVVWHRGRTMHPAYPYVHVCPSDILCPTVLKRKANMVHLPVLHGSGVVRQSHAALQEDRKKQRGLEVSTSHRNHLLWLPSSGLWTCNICRARQKGKTVESSAA